MNKHKNIINNLIKGYEIDKNNIALLVTGSVARDEASKNSDLDLLVITKSKQPFQEKIISGITVEFKTNSVDGFIEKMKNDPINVYQWLDAKVIFDKDNVSEKIISEAKSIYNNYKTDPKELIGVKKWLESAKIKIESAKENNDDLTLGFNVSNNLWTIVRGLYLLNNKPVPPSTTAFKRIKELDNLPENFDKLWKDMLTEDLSTRTEASLIQIDVIVSYLA